MTALPVEGAAFSSLVPDLERVTLDDDPNHYRLGYVSSSDAARPHRVALVTLPQDNTRNAAATCTDLLRTFQNIRCVLMIGIAGGIPAPQRPERHVRLGDVVVAMDGIVDFGHVRQVDGTESVRRPVEGVCVELQRAANEMRQVELESGTAPWARETGAARGRPLAAFARPPAETDRLIVAGLPAKHPSPGLTGHRPGRPKVHFGAVGSGDVLLRDEQRRDELAARYRVLAVEMEGSGIAASARLRGVPWFMVRGISDYCDSAAAGDRWHPYAAMAAARYTWALLGACRPFPAWPTSPGSGVLALVSGPERDDIIRVLEQVSELDPRTLWHAAAGDLAPLPERPLATLGQVFDHLAGLNAHEGLPPAVALLEEAAHQAGEPHAGRLKWWADHLAGRLGALQALQAHRQRRAPKDEQVEAKPCLVVQITPDGIDARRCLTNYWIQYRSGPWRPEPGGEDGEAFTSSLEPVVERYIREAERAWRDSHEPVSVEFLMPTSLLNVAVEWWRTDADSAAPSPLGVDYEVVLRNLDRMRAEHRHRMWSVRWQALWRGDAARRVLWAGAAGSDLRQWGAHLRFRTEVACVVLSSSPAEAVGRQELDLALRAGVPVVMWDRRGQPDETMAGAVRRLAEGDPARLRTALRELRAQAAAAGPRDADRHPGRHLAVVWDDPDRLVDLLGARP
ncbi:MAG TPA: hypothetical protein VFU73_06560 [Actinocrinis sp.]|nr:hypothetical protein [Actinocrinis sp.]